MCSWCLCSSSGHQAATTALWQQSHSWGMETALLFTRSPCSWGDGFLSPHLLRLRREAEEEGAEVRWRQSCGKSDQDPASTCWNGSLLWLFNRAALEVTAYQCGPAIFAGQRSSATEINEKAPPQCHQIRLTPQVEAEGHSAVKHKPLQHN